MPKVKMIRPKLMKLLEAKKRTKESISAAALLLGVSEEAVESFVKKAKQVRKPVDLIGKYEQTIAELQVTLKTGTITREYLNERAVLESRISELTSAVDELRDGTEPLKTLINELSEPWLKCADYFANKNRHASSASTGFFKEQTLRLAKEVNNAINVDDEVQD